MYGLSMTRWCGCSFGSRHSVSAHHRPPARRSVREENRLCSPVCVHQSVKRGLQNKLSKRLSEQAPSSQQHDGALERTTSTMIEQTRGVSRGMSCEGGSRGQNRLGPGKSCEGRTRHGLTGFLDSLSLVRAIRRKVCAHASEIRSLHSQRQSNARERCSQKSNEMMSRVGGMVFHVQGPKRCCAVTARCVAF